ncbi:MAG: hypothetical protein AB1726_02000 [Planctomycetota bacterium]
MLKSLLSAAFALAALGAVGPAQQQAGAPVSVPGPPGRASLDLATGELTRDAPDKVANVVIVWANTDYSGYYSTGWNPPFEWLDWGSVFSWFPHDIVGEYQFGYGTTVLDTSVGGPGVTLCTSFYSGATGWCNEQGIGLAPTAQFCFSGLPGTTGTGPAGWVISASLTGGSEFVLPDGPFGFSLSMFETQTGPLLCYAGSLSGGFDYNGQQDVFDWYVPDVGTGTCGTYWFGGPPWNFSSWWMHVAEWDAQPPATSIWYCGNNVNCNGYTTGSIVLGGLWVNSVVACGNNVGAFLAGFVGPAIIPWHGMEILVDFLLSPELLGFPSALGDPAIILLPVPLNLALAGLTIYVQAAGFGWGIRLHCAYACTIGG